MNHKLENTHFKNVPNCLIILTLDILLPHDHYIWNTIENKINFNFYVFNDEEKIKILYALKILKPQKCSENLRKFLVEDFFENINKKDFKLVLHFMYLMKGYSHDIYHLKIIDYINNNFKNIEKYILDNNDFDLAIDFIYTYQISRPKTVQRKRLYTEDQIEKETENILNKFLPFVEDNINSLKNMSIYRLLSSLTHLKEKSSENILFLIQNYYTIDKIMVLNNWEISDILYFMGTTNNLSGIGDLDFWKNIVPELIKRDKENEFQKDDLFKLFYSISIFNNLNDKEFKYFENKLLKFLDLNNDIENQANQLNLNYFILACLYNNKRDKELFIKILRYISFKNEWLQPLYYKSFKMFTDISKELFPNFNYIHIDNLMFYLNKEHNLMRLRKKEIPLILIEMSNIFNELNIEFFLNYEYENNFTISFANPYSKIAIFIIDESFYNLNNDFEPNNSYLNKYYLLKKELLIKRKWIVKEIIKKDYVENPDQKSYLENLSKTSLSESVKLNGDYEDQEKIKIFHNYSKNLLGLLSSKQRKAELNEIGNIYENKVLNVERELFKI